MKKVLAVLLTLILVVGMVPTVVSAVEEGEGPTVTTESISSAADFLGMDPAGAYTLEADITLDATFSGGKFTGTLNGNGHTITIKAPIFEEIEGTVYDLVIDGEIKTDDMKDVGALSKKVSGGSYSRITNNTDIENTTSISSGYATAGGLFGYLTIDNLVSVYNFTNNGTIHSVECAAGAVADSAKGAKIDFVNCINNGDITGDTNSTGGIFGLGESNSANRAVFNFTNCQNNGTIKSGSDSAGGICAYGQGWASYTFKNCINTGNVSSDSGGYNSGGILGDGDGDMYFENCLNTGDVTHKGSHAGGIVGDITDDATFTNCINTGDITAKKMAAGIAATVNYPLFYNCGNTGNITAGSDTGSGILSYCKPNSSFAPEFMYCFNTGDITGNDCITGITGYFNSTTEAKLVGCYNLGNLSAVNSSYETCALYYSNYATDLTAGNVVDCYYIENCATYESHYKGNYNAINAANVLTATQVAEADFAWNFTDADIASGKLCYYMNQIAGTTVFYQNLAEDAAPSIDSSRGNVVLVGGNFINPSTGDSSNMTAVIVVAAVSLIGMGITAVLLKKKVNN